MKRRPFIWVRFVFWLCMIVANTYGVVHYSDIHEWIWMALAFGAMCISWFAASEAWEELER